MEYSIKPKRLGERRIIHYPQKRIIGLYVYKIDIEDFIETFLNLEIVYADFAEESKERIGFLSDGETPLMIKESDTVISKIYEKDKIVLQRYLLDTKENGRRRFTLAHEASHYILNHIGNMEENRISEETHTYTINELAKLCSIIERQADMMAAILLMPLQVVEHAFELFFADVPPKLYGEHIISLRDKNRLKDMSEYLGVSYTALVIRLKDLKRFEVYSVEDYITGQLSIGA